MAFLRNPMFSRFDTTPVCDTQTHTHNDGIYHTSIELHGKNRQIQELLLACVMHTKLSKI